jgi:hypothetical protein
LPEHFYISIINDSIQRIGDDSGAMTVFGASVNQTVKNGRVALASDYRPDNLAQ